MASETPDNGFRPDRRLHGLSWLFVAAGYLKQFVVPLAVAVVLGAKNDYALWGLVLIVPMIVGALWHQWIYRYGFSPRGLVIHEGLFFRNVRTIDYGRIENVDTERSLLHRLLGVAQVRVETSSGGKAEALIRVLDLAAVREMREHIFGVRQTGSAAATATAATAEEETQLLRLGPGELVRFGLIDNRGMVVVVALLGLLIQGGFFEAMEQWAEPLLRDLPWQDLARFSLLTQILLGVTTLFGLIAGTRILSILMAFVTLFDFRLTRRGSDLYTRYGLLTRISLTLRQPRIQAVHQTAGVLHRLLRRVSLRVDLAGGLAASADNQPGNQRTNRELWLAPVCTPAMAEDLMRTALPGVSLAGLDWHGLSPRARWRLFRLLGWLWLLPASGPAIWFTGWWSIALLAAPLPLLWAYAHLYVKYTGWALTGEFFVLQRGWLNRKLSVAPRNRIQSVALSESPFDRRYRMAELEVDTAGASSWSHRLRIPFLDRGDAEQLAAELYRSRLRGFGGAAQQTG